MSKQPEEFRTQLDDSIIRILTKGPKTTLELLGRLAFHYGHDLTKRAIEELQMAGKIYKGLHQDRKVGVWIVR